MYQFRIPFSASLRWEGVFKSDEAKRAHFIAASDARGAALSATTPESMSCYLPLVLALSAEITAKAGERIELQQQLSFVWSSALMPAEEKRIATLGLVPHDALMALASVGYRLHEHAARLVQQEKPDIAEAAKALRAAAGVFVYLQEFEVLRLMPRSSSLRELWLFLLLLSLLQSKHGLRPNDLLPEMSPFVASALSHWCLAEAQELAITTAREKHRRPPSDGSSGSSALPASAASLLTKLCVAAMDEFTAARADLVKGTGNAFTRLDPSINIYLKAKAEIYRALSLRYIGFHATADGEHGKAVAAFTASVAELKAVFIPRSAQENPALPALVKALALELAISNKYLAEALRDNERVYFCPVPPAAELKLPPGLLLGAATPYAPELPEVSYF